MKLISSMKLACAAFALAGFATLSTAPAAEADGLKERMAQLQGFVDVSNIGTAIGPRVSGDSKTWKEMFGRVQLDTAGKNRVQLDLSGGSSGWTRASGSGKGQISVGTQEVGEILIGGGIVLN